MNLFEVQLWGGQSMGGSNLRGITCYTLPAAGLCASAEPRSAGKIKPLLGYPHLTGKMCSPGEGSRIDYLVLVCLFLMCLSPGYWQSTTAQDADSLVCRPTHCCL